MRPKLINGKYVITKNTWYLLDENGSKIVNEKGDLVTFPSKLEAEEYLENNNITGTVK